MMDKLDAGQPEQRTPIHLLLPAEELRRGLKKLIAEGQHIKSLASIEQSRRGRLARAIRDGVTAMKAERAKQKGMPFHYPRSAEYPASTGARLPGMAADW